MQKILQFQSNLAISASFIVALLSFGMDSHLSSTMLLGSLLLIVILGVPHGSLDILFARQTYQLVHITKWLKFLLLYSACSLLIIALWMLAPSLFFIIFLILSAIHFSDDINLSGNQLLKLSYGFAIISLPGVMHGAELTKLYAMIIDEGVSEKIVLISKYLGIFLLGLLAVLIVSKKICIRTKFEIIAISILFLTTTPILAFTLYFCLMHSARHLIRSHFFLTHADRKEFIFSLILPTLAVIILGAGIWYFKLTPSVEKDLIQIIFVGLAALTVPHAWVLQKANFSKWATKSF
jgi:Brp/Blh family beta-carotene 15,15'-monooxygenase